MYELIDPEFVTSQKITNIFKNAYIDIKEAQYLSDSDSYYWMIELNSEGVLIGLDPKEKQFDIGENTALCTYNEFENNERFILNLINEMNKRFNIRSYIRLDKSRVYAFFQPGQCIDMAKVLILLILLMNVVFCWRLSSYIQLFGS